MTAEFTQLIDHARRKGLIDDQDTSVIFYDLSALGRQAERVRRAFPADALHAVAVKTNPLSSVLAEVARLGLGGEAASYEELYLARRVSATQRLIWDSPAKTASEIAQVGALQPSFVNADSLDELYLHPDAPAYSLGLRINPEIEPDAPDAYRVGHSRSKFGVPITRYPEIAQAFGATPALQGLHVHSSSGTQSLASLVSGVRRVLDLALRLNRESAADAGPRVRWIDIGGGLPMAEPEDPALSVEAYARKLQTECPELFDEQFLLITEFGRYYHYAAGWTLTTVEYAHQTDVGQDLVVHVGADHFLREAYTPKVWPLFFELVKRQSDAGPETRRLRTRIGGPLCFEGDRLATDVLLPNAGKGDYLVIRNTGANTFALWSRHCSRAFPKVITYRPDQGPLHMAIAKQRESFEDLARFWG